MLESHGHFPAFRTQVLNIWKSKSRFVFPPSPIKHIPYQSLSHSTLRRQFRLSEVLHFISTCLQFWIIIKSYFLATFLAFRIFIVIILYDELHALHTESWGCTYFLKVLESSASEDCAGFKTAWASAFNHGPHTFPQGYFSYSTTSCLEHHCIEFKNGLLPQKLYFR